MPNGGHISCVDCTYSRSQNGICDIFGIETSGNVICRSFRMPKQSHSSARRQWPFLLGLKSGVVYGIDNDAFSTGNPQAIFKTVPCHRGKMPLEPVSTKMPREERHKPKSFNIDADLENEDWIKAGRWDLPPWGSEEFNAYLKSSGMTLEQFKTLPVYKHAVRRGEIKE